MPSAPQISPCFFNFTPRGLYLQDHFACRKEDPNVVHVLRAAPRAFVT